MHEIQRIYLDCFEFNFCFSFERDAINEFNFSDIHARSYDIDNEGLNNFPGDDETPGDLNAVEELGKLDLNNF